MSFLDNGSIEKNFKFPDFSVVFYCKVQWSEKWQVLAFSVCVCLSVCLHTHTCMSKRGECCPTLEQRRNGGTKMGLNVNM